MVSQKNPPSDTGDMSEAIISVTTPTWQNDVRKYNIHIHSVCECKKNVLDIEIICAVGYY